MPTKFNCKKKTNAINTILQCQTCSRSFHSSFQLLLSHSPNQQKPLFPSGLHPTSCACLDKPEVHGPSVALPRILSAWLGHKLQNPEEGQTWRHIHLLLKPTFQISLTYEGVGDVGPVDAALKFQLVVGLNVEKQMLVEANPRDQVCPVGALQGAPAVDVLDVGKQGGC